MLSKFSAVVFYYLFLSYLLSLENVLLPILIKISSKVDESQRLVLLCILWLGMFLLHLCYAFIRHFYRKQLWSFITVHGKSKAEILNMKFVSK